MKKLISSVLALMLVLTFAACGGNAASSDDSAASSEPSKIVVGVVQTNANESDWRTANTKSFNEAFAAAGFETKMVFGEGDHAKQIAQAQQLIQEEVDYLVVLGLQSAGWEDVAKSAQEAGIPFIMADRKLDLSEDLYTAMVCSDFEAEGNKAVDWLKAQNVADAKIVVLGGDTGSSAQLGRSKAIEDGANAKRLEYRIQSEYEGLGTKRLQSRLSLTLSLPEQSSTLSTLKTTTWLAAHATLWTPPVLHTARQAT